VGKGKLGARILFKLNSGDFVFRQYPLLESVPSNQVYHILLNIPEKKGRRLRAMCGYAPEGYAWKNVGGILELPPSVVCSKCEKLARNRKVLSEIVG
jgi:hypothetical protein